MFAADTLRGTVSLENYLFSNVHFLLLGYGLLCLWKGEEEEEGYLGEMKIKNPTKPHD